MNTPVNAKLAKLLKEKEYKDKNALGTVRLSEPKYYDPNGIIHNITDAFEVKDYKIEDCYNAPTIAEVVMWLYEKHEIWIQVKPGGKLESWDFIVQKKDNNFAVPYFEIKQHKSFFNSPVEAYEAAIDDALNKVI